MPDIVFELAEERPVCGQRRTKSSETYCELPPDHNIGGESVPWHHGRNRAGRWMTWGHKPSRKAAADA